MKDPGTVWRGLKGLENGPKRVFQEGPKIGQKRCFLEVVKNGQNRVFSGPPWKACFGPFWGPFWARPDGTETLHRTL